VGRKEAGWMGGRKEGKLLYIFNTPYVPNWEFFDSKVNKESSPLWKQELFSANNFYYRADVG
jgi:hypothetical protein